MQAAWRRVLFGVTVLSLVGLSLGSAAAGFTVVVPRPPRLDEEPSIPTLPEAHVGVQGIHGETIDSEPNDTCADANTWPDGVKGESVGRVGWTDGGFDMEDWSKLFVVKSEFLEISVANVTAEYFDSACAPANLAEEVAATGDFHVRLTPLNPGGSDLYEIGFTLIPNDAGLGRDAADLAGAAEVVMFPGFVGTADFGGGLRQIGTTPDSDWYRYEVRPAAASIRQEAGLFHLRYSHECSSHLETPTSVTVYSGDAHEELMHADGSCEAPVDFVCVYVGSTAPLSHIEGGSRGYVLEASTIPLRIVNTENDEWHEFVIDTLVQTGPPQIMDLVSQLIQTDLPRETPWCDRLSSEAFEILRSGEVDGALESAQFIVNAAYGLLE